MKKIFLPVCSAALLFWSCQKSVSTELEQHDTFDDSVSFTTGDLLTYEVITADTTGWFGIWTDEDGKLGRTVYDNGSWGSPVYNAGGWKYSFPWSGYSGQLMMSVFTAAFMDSITINLYKNDALIKSVSNYGVAKVIYNVTGTTQSGTGTDPVLTYEVLIDEMDSTQNQYDAWNGNWVTGDGLNINDENYSSELLPIPSGWRYTFKPASLPFTMNLQAWPYTNNASRVTLNFYVNGTLVKTAAARELTGPLTYEVQ